MAAVILGGASHRRLLAQRLGGETMGTSGKAQQLQGKEDIKKFSNKRPWRGSRGARRRFKHVPAAQCFLRLGGEVDQRTD